MSALYQVKHNLTYLEQCVLSTHFLPEKNNSCVCHLTLPGEQMLLTLPLVVRIDAKKLQGRGGTRELIKGKCDGVFDLFV